MPPVFRGGVVARVVGVSLQDVDVFAGKPHSDSCEEWQPCPEDLYASLS